MPEYVFKSMIENQSLIRLRKIADFLKKSGRFYFQNFNISIFLKSIKEDSEIFGIINNLLSHFPDIRERIENVLRPQNPSSVGEIRRDITNFEEWVAFCFFYLQESVRNGNAIIDNFRVDTSQKKDDEGLSPKLQFYNDCIEPIIIYLELQLTQRLNAIHILQRYKVLCEWYDREELKVKKETEITKKHLSKFLFDQGFTYSLSETTVPSGKIDNFVLDLGLKDKTELNKLPEAIIIEGKIFKGKRQSIFDVKQQLSKRLQDLFFNDGYCVVYNKSKTKIVLGNINGSINGFYYLSEGDRRIYFIIVNLNDEFYKSKSDIKERRIDFKK